MILRPLSATDLSRNVQARLEASLPAVLARTSRPLPTPNDYTMTPTPEAIRRVTGVALAVIVTGTTDSARMGGSEMDLDWSVVVTVWHENTKATPLLVAAGDYAAAIRSVLLATPPTLASSVEYGSEDQTLVSDEVSNRYLGSASVTFTVRTGSLIHDDLVADDSGPTVQTTDVTVNPTT